MFGRLETPEQIFSFKLGAALTMERTVLDMLAELQEHANRDEVKSALAVHAEETRQHITNVERCFELLGEEVDDSPCAAIEGIDKEGQATLKKIDDSLADAGVLASAIETEHHEIAVYEVLITGAEARGRSDVAALLRQNLEQEQETLEHVRSLSRRIADGEGFAVASS